MPRHLVALLLIATPVTAAPVPKALQVKGARLDGTWEVVCTELGGEVRLGTGQTWEIDGETVVLRNNGQVGGSAHYTLVVPTDGGADAVDFTTVYDKSGETVLQRGRRVTDGDTLTLYLAMRGERPAEAKAGKGVIVYSFRRVKVEK